MFQLKNDRNILGQKQFFDKEIQTKDTIIKFRTQAIYINIIIMHAD